MNGDTVPYMEASGSIAEQVDTWLSQSTLSAAQIAARAGVSGSTVHRIRNGLVDPSVGTLRDIAIACGLSIDIASRPLSDALAAEAARSILEEGFTPTSDVSDWKARLTRSTHTPREILRAASEAANPLARPGAKHFAGKVTTGLLASAGSMSGGDWAVSGTAGLILPVERQEAVDGHNLLWVADADSATKLIRASLREVPHPAAAQLTVIAADNWLFQNSFEHESVRYPAPIQIMLDCLAIGDTTSQRAEEIVGEW